MFNFCVVIGYSGHSFVSIDALISSGYSIKEYVDQQEKENNPYGLVYLGKDEIFFKLPYSEERLNVFVGIGSNSIRRKVFEEADKHGKGLVNAVHQSAVIASNARFDKGVLIAAGCCINPLAQIGKGVICNTNSSIDHECCIGDFSHIAPGAVLCGNVIVGNNSFIGANSVIKEGVKIGNNVTVGAGSVVLKDVPDSSIIFGNPAITKL